AGPSASSPPSLHDALPIWRLGLGLLGAHAFPGLGCAAAGRRRGARDRRRTGGSAGGARRRTRSLARAAPLPRRPLLRVLPLALTGADPGGAVCRARPLARSQAGARRLRLPALGRELPVRR